MTARSDEDPWLLLSQIVEVRSPWLSVIGERLRTQRVKSASTGEWRSQTPCW